MKTKLLCLLPLLLAAALSAQEKGAAPVALQNSIPSPRDKTQNSIRAVVIGISDYQDPAIPDLQFAHRDAEAFAAWLQSAAGGSVPAENIQLLLNEKATMGRVAMALWALMTQCVEGDQAIIYFSGHGDVETKTIAQPGYWLCWDSPPYAYMSGGCFNVRDLQDIVATLSRQNQARVLVISDACHAGKLAGSDIGGPQATAQNLATQFANEVKILSCQPNEFSLEGTQWGGGRGCFSYHLTDGLCGLADRNEDDLVTLVELENYLEDRVPEETAPHRQFPFTIGDKLARLARVDAPTLARIKAGKAGAQPSLEPIDPRGMEDWALARADSSIRELYTAFNAALERGELLEPKGTSADDYYRRLIREPELAPVHGLMTRNFAAALVDESQQVTNKLLKTDPNVVSDAWSRPFVFDHIPGYIARAIELLGEQHFLYKHLKAKQLFFEAKTYRTDNYPDTSPDSLLKITAVKMENALRYDSNAAYACVELSLLFYYKFTQLDKALVYAEKALALSPNWVYAQYVTGTCNRNINMQDAEFHLCKALELDSTFLPPFQELSMLYWRHGKQEKKVFYQQKFIRKVKALIESNPQRVPVLYRTLLGAELAKANRMEEAVEILQQAGTMSKGQDFGIYQWLGATYYALGRYEDGLIAAKKQLELAPGNLEGYLQLFQGYKKLNQPARAVDALDNAIALSSHKHSIDPYLAFFHALMGETLQELGRREEAKAQFQKIREILPNPNNPWEMSYVGRSHLGLGDIKAMEKIIDEGIKKFEGDNWCYYLTATLYSLARQEEKALEWLETALKNGFSDFYIIRGDFDMDNIRQSSGFKALLKKYFPDQVKD